MKNINNKGFTLIELIATIALLAIIAAISFVSISKVIEQSKVNDCNSLVTSIKSATNEYVSDKRYDSNFINSVSNSKVNITASALINNNYLTSPIINPFTKKEIKANDISIEIVLNSNYTVESITITKPNVLKKCKK